jgi:uncharacterized protein (DUF2147 family)
MSGEGAAHSRHCAVSRRRPHWTPVTAALLGASGLMRWRRPIRSTAGSRRRRDCFVARRGARPAACLLCLGAMRPGRGMRYVGMVLHGGTFMIRRFVILFALVMAGPALAATPSASISPAGVTSSSPLSGFWVTNDGNWVVQIGPCNSGFCGRLVGVNPRPSALHTDAHNPDPAKRNTLLCGLIMMGGFRPSKSDAGTWVEGWVYNPENGKTYSSQLSLNGQNTLKVRGYVLVSWLGRTETLKRETAATNRCMATLGND